MTEKFSLLSLLPSSLRRRGDSSITEHCNPETLIAFAERTLHAKEREAAAHHLSLCPDCRQVLALAAEAGIPAPHAKRRLASTRAPWLYSAAALVALCLAAAWLVPSSKPPAPRPVAKSSSPNITFSPQLTAARITAPVLTVVNPTWRVDASHYPASLEASYDNRRTWTTIHTPNLDLKSVASEGARVWVAGADGTILQSNDNGLHWTRLPPTFHVSAVGASATH